MKIDVLTLAPAFLPVVPAAYRGIAAAVLDEIKATREANAARDRQIDALTRAVNAQGQTLRALGH